MNQYDTIQCYDLKELHKRVSHACRRGYIPQGGIAVCCEDAGEDLTTTTYTQALYKPEKKEYKTSNFLTPAQKDALRAADLTICKAEESERKLKASKLEVKIFCTKSFLNLAVEADNYIEAREKIVNYLKAEFYSTNMDPGTANQNIELAENLELDDFTIHYLIK